MVQYALPISTFNDVGWEEGAGDGGGAGDSWDELNEGHGAGRGSGSGPDAATTYWRNTGTTGFTFGTQQNLGAVTDPVVHTGHIVRSQNRKHASGGRQIDITPRLQQEDTYVEGLNFPNVDNVWTVRSFTLTESRAATITDYTLLRQRTYGTPVGGGGPRDAEESAMEFECPDAPAGGGFAHSQGVIVG